MIEQAGGVEALAVAVDGRPVPDPARFRVAPMRLAPPGPPTPGGGSAAVSCGYFLLLAPPSVGEHAIRLTVAPAGTVVVDITWRLTVVEPSTGTPTIGAPSP